MLDHLLKVSMLQPSYEERMKYMIWIERVGILQAALGLLIGIGLFLLRNGGLVGLHRKNNIREGSINDAIITITRISQNTITKRVSYGFNSLQSASDKDIILIVMNSRQCDWLINDLAYRVRDNYTSLYHYSQNRLIVLLGRYLREP